MQEERLMILNMLAEGKITVEEAEKLLQALGKETAKGAKQAEADNSEQAKDDGYGWSFFHKNFGPDIEQNFVEFSQDIEEMINKHVHPNLDKAFKAVDEAFQNWSSTKKH